MNYKTDPPPSAGSSNEDIEALSEAINLAPMGVLSKKCVARLIEMRQRLLDNPTT